MKNMSSPACNLIPLVLFFKTSIEVNCHEVLCVYFPFCHSVKKKKMCTEGSSLINVILSIASLSITLNEKSICFYFKCVVGRNTTGIVWCSCCYNLCQDASTFIHHCFCSISAMSTWLFQN